MNWRIDGLVIALRWSIVPAIAVALSGCFHYYPPEAPKGGVSVETIEALVKCQQKVSKAGSKFTKTVGKSLLKCVEEPFIAQLAFENGLLSSEGHEAAMAQGASDCEKPLAKIAKQSGKYVDNALKNCADVSDTLLGDYDALRFALAADTAGATGATTLEEVFGQLCGVQMLMGQGPVLAAFPRTIEMMTRMLPEIVLAESSPPSEIDPVAISVLDLPLDPRCSEVVARRALATLGSG